MDNGKAAITLHLLNKHFSELNLDVVNNSNIKVKHIGKKDLHLKEKGRLALNLINKIRDLWWSPDHLNVPTKPYISPSKSLNKKNICNLRTSEISNYLTYERQHLESNCSGVNKNSINKNGNLCNTLQKLRINIPLRIIVGQLNINSVRNKFDALCSIFKQKIDILLVSESKIDDTFPLAQFCVEGYSTSYRLDRTCKGGGLLLYVRDDIPSKQIKLKFIENEAFEAFFVEINLRKKVASLLII